MDLADAYREVRAASEALCAPVSAEDCAVQSMPDASPAKWHLAHTTWFFETLVLEGLPGYAPFHPAFRVLFNSYYSNWSFRSRSPSRRSRAAMPSHWLGRAPRYQARQRKFVPPPVPGRLARPQGVVLPHANDDRNLGKWTTGH